MSLNEKNPTVKILNNFYGQIKNIKISFYNREKGEINSKIINPFPLKDFGGKIFSSIYNYKKNIITDSKDKSDFALYKTKNDEYNELKITIKVENQNLCKVNYINFKEEKFNIINYFGGIMQFLPFLNIINGLYNNKNILNIDEQPKGKILFYFAKNILLVIFNYVNKVDNKTREFLGKYWTFFLYIINKIEPFKFEKTKIDTKEFISNKTDNIYSKIIYNFIEYINNDQNDKNNALQYLIDSQYNKDREVKDRIRTDKLSLFGKTNSQLYRHIMKQLFVYNRLWSKQYLYFNDVPNCYKKYKKEENIYQIKYKRLNYYTTNFQQPFIYPILEIDHFYPNFKKFKKENLYKNSNEKILNYDFSLDKFKNNSLNEQIINNYLYNDNNKYINNSVECCLIKKMYHVKGRFGFIMDNKYNDNFTYYFISGSEINNGTCNRKDNKGLCHGSIFSCLKKDKSRIIYFPREKIVFAIMRIYYQRLSGFEIFTIDNKSYYFNFKEEINEANSNDTNKILNKLKENFKPIKTKYFKTFGWFNPDFENICYPLFSENIDEWQEKHIYSNFDKLMIINLFSNRSFNDLNQYPVFPMLYNILNQERSMNKPIGFQEINEESKKRTQLIQDSYFYEKEYGNDDNQELNFFNILFSNLTFVCHYLIRVYPYSFISIEIQGDGFDAADRLFFSISSAMNNTLSQRSDLRELIPEMFYFPQLFANMNNIELHKLSDGSNIDEVYIKNKNENNFERYNFLKNMRNYLEEQENLNEWIDLIFGINKEFNENNERYYNSDRNVEFKTKPEFIEDDLMLQSCDFGVLPMKLFNEKFPTQNKIDKNLEKEIITFNTTQFVKDHMICLTDEKISVICLGEKGINSKYLDDINKKSFLSKFYNFFSAKKYDKNMNISYLFTGDVFGNLSIYKKIKSKSDMINLMNIYEDFRETNVEKEIIDDLENNKYILLKQLSDHTKEIKYIDYNPRLNLLADYSLDGFINIYMMPSFKLIRAIQTKDLNIPGKINKIALISYPFPILCCVSNLKIIIMDINGQIIKIKDVGKECEVQFSVDKDCGKVRDYFVFKENKISQLEHII